MGDAKIETDESGKKFIEVLLANDEKVRVTVVEESWAGVPGVRIQIRSIDGHLRQGPEIPITEIGHVVAAIIELVRR
jgi:hypothetical protein